MNKSHTFSVTSMKQTGLKLANLPTLVRTTVDKKGYVEGLKVELHSALAKGYSFADLAKILKDDNFEIAPATLKSYLGAKPKSEPKQPKTNKLKTETTTSSNQGAQENQN